MSCEKKGGGRTDAWLEVLAHETLEGVVELLDVLVIGVAGRAAQLAVSAVDLLQQRSQLALLALALGGCAVVHSQCGRVRDSHGIQHAPTPQVPVSCESRKGKNQSNTFCLFAS